MKKAFMILILSIILPMLLIIPVHAETQEVPVSFEVAATTDYQWSVPAQSLNFVFDNNVFANGTSLSNQEVSITQKNGVPILLPVGASLDISVSSANGYKLQLTSDELSSSVPYHIRKSGEDNDIGSTIYSLKAGNTDGGSQLLDFIITADEAKNAKLAGNHTDTLTFEIKQVIPGATFSKQLTCIDSSHTAMYQHTDTCWPDLISPVTLTWDELKLAENGTKYGYDASAITDDSIGENAFGNCTSLTSITIPNSVTSIGTRALNYCTSLTSVTIGNGVTSIGQKAFSDCSILTDINIPNSVTNIEKWAFSYCDNLTSITIPDSVTSIGDGAFIHCSILTSINVNENNTVYKDIDGVLFNTSGTLLHSYPAGKTGSYTIPNSVESIGNYAFYWCYRLTNINIPDNVTSIGECAFIACTKLTSITIPNGVESIGKQAFSTCNLTSVIFEEGSQLTSIGQEAFYYCQKLTNMPIPDSVTSIGNSAFCSCKNLTSIYYSGTKEQWNTITKGNNWNYNTGNYTIHCTDGDIAKS